MDALMTAASWMLVVPLYASDKVALIVDSVSDMVDTDELSADADMTACGDSGVCAKQTDYENGYKKRCVVTWKAINCLQRDNATSTLIHMFVLSRQDSKLYFLTY